MQSVSTSWTTYAFIHEEVPIFQLKTVLFVMQAGNSSLVPSSSPDLRTCLTGVDQISPSPLNFANKRKSGRRCGRLIKGGGARRVRGEFPD